MTRLRRDLRGAGGYTLIEISIALAVIALLASVVVPLFGESIRNTYEGTTKKNLDSVRDALTIYYGYMVGSYPLDNLTVLVQNKRYKNKFPKVKL